LWLAIDDEIVAVLGLAASLASAVSDFLPRAGSSRARHFRGSLGSGFQPDRRARCVLNFVWDSFDSLSNVSVDASQSPSNYGCQSDQAGAQQSKRPRFGDVGGDLGDP